MSKTRDYTLLSDAWKGITRASDNAIFPMIIIDDKILWYGLPKSRGLLGDGKDTFITVCQTIYRIQGRHTIDIIKDFSSFELREIDGVKSPITEKKSNQQEIFPTTGNEPTGLDAFIHDKEKCSKCKASMKLAKGHKGGFFIKCTSKDCKETRNAINLDYVNWYIMARKVKCPRCGCDIEAKYGRFGVYAQCDMEHNLSLEEI